MRKITLVDKGELPEETVLPLAWDFDFCWVGGSAFVFCVFLRDSTAKKAKFDATLYWVWWTELYITFYVFTSRKSLMSEGKHGLIGSGLLAMQESSHQNVGALLGKASLLGSLSDKAQASRTMPCT